MKDLGGDCSQSECGSMRKCQAKCDALREQGCIGFVTALPIESNACYMRMLGSGETCDDAMEASTSYTTVTHGDCQPSKGVRNFTAKYAIPIPFLPSAVSSRLRIEFTVATRDKVDHFKLLTNS